MEQLIPPPNLLPAPTGTRPPLLLLLLLRKIHPCLTDARVSLSCHVWPPGGGAPRRRQRPPPSAQPVHGSLYSTRGASLLFFFWCFSFCSRTIRALDLVAPPPPLAPLPLPVSRHWLAHSVALQPLGGEGGGGALDAPWELGAFPRGNLPHPVRRLTLIARPGVVVFSMA